MAAASNNELDYEILPYVRVFKNGTVERLRGTESIPPGTDPLTGVTSKDITDIIPETEVYVRIYCPKLSNSNNKLPLLLYFHGGAFLLYTPSSPLYHDYLNALVSQSQVIAVSVHYRRAPEHPLPIAYQDSWEVLKWVASHCKGDGPEPLLNCHVDFQRLFLCGDSAGANIVHNLAMSAGNADAGFNIEIQGIVLVDPYFHGLDPVGENQEEKVVVDPVWPLVCPSYPDKDNPWVNPFAEGGASLGTIACRRVLICVAEKDVFKEAGRLYFEILGRSGWMGMVEMHETEEEGHCFHLKDRETERAKERMTRMVNFLTWDMPLPYA